VEEGADAIVADWRMPGLQGPELCRRVRAHAARPYTYFILLTALTDRAHVLAGREAGSDDYLTKPFDLDDLGLRLQVAERATSLHRHREELLRLEAVLIAARTMQHELNNRLSVTVGHADLLYHSPQLPLELRELALEALRGAEDSADVLKRLQGLTDLRTKDWGAGLAPTLDLSPVLA